MQKQRNDGKGLIEQKNIGVKDYSNALEISSTGYSPGEIATHYEYDNMGRAIKQINPMGNALVIDYNALGDITSVKSPDDTTITYSRNYNQNPLTVTDENGNAVKHAYTPMGLDYKVIDVLSGNVLTRKEHDANLRLVKETDVVHGTSINYTYSYDLGGLLLSNTDRNGR